MASEVFVILSPGGKAVPARRSHWLGGVGLPAWAKKNVFALNDKEIVCYTLGE